MGEMDAGPHYEPDPTTPTVIPSASGSKDGLNKCVRCGATEIAFNIASGLLMCGFCRYEWSSRPAHDVLNINGYIGELSGVTVGSGALDIVPTSAEQLTLKCGGCGAEVVIDTRNSTQARCHWCRNKLSINQQIPNGAVPDMVLPFKLTREAAVGLISQFVRKRRFFAHPRFRSEFNPENVMGVYMPYLVVDINARVSMSGRGEHQTRSYTVKTGENDSRRVYDADVYEISRKFDLHINDLTVESSSARLAKRAAHTNNVINSIMPFDVENAVVYDANYMAGFTSERRDTNVEDLRSYVTVQSGDIARHRVLPSIKFYDRGVQWRDEAVELRGERWVSAYLPVWLYSYHQKKSNGKSQLHYVAVNARTGETMGSVPLNYPKLWAVSAVVQLVSLGLFGLLVLGGLL